MITPLPPPFQCCKCSICHAGRQVEKIGTTLYRGGGGGEDFMGRFSVMTVSLMLILYLSQHFWQGLSEFINENICHRCTTSFPIYVEITNF